MNSKRVRKLEVNVKGDKIEYDEYYLVDDNGEEVFDRNIEIENDIRLYDTYKKKHNLLTSSEIKKIRNKYGLNQKEYALAIGLGEITVHRFENGSIQTDSVDAIMRLSSDVVNMKSLVLQNKKNLDEIVYNKLISRIEELIILKKHIVLDISEVCLDNLEFEEESCLVVAENIIYAYNSNVNDLVKKYDVLPEYITNLKLQKLLYYVQGISLCMFGRKAFPEKIMAWSYGPVVNEVYQKYKDKHYNEIKVLKRSKGVSSGLEWVINEVVSTYGKMDANNLIVFTHEESPWKETCINKEIDVDSIIKYFNLLYKEV